MSINNIFQRAVKKSLTRTDEFLTPKLNNTDLDKVRISLVRVLPKRWNKIILKDIRVVLDSTGEGNQQLKFPFQSKPNIIQHDISNDSTSNINVYEAKWIVSETVKAGNF